MRQEETHSETLLQPGVCICQAPYTRLSDNKPRGRTKGSGQLPRARAVLESLGGVTAELVRVTQEASWV